MPASRESLGELFVEIKADVEDIKRELKKVETNAQKTGQTVESKMGAAFKRVGGILIGLQLGKTILGWATSAIKAAANFQTLRTRLNALYGDARKGSQAFASFVKVAATTPFSVSSVVEAGATLKAFGASATRTIKPVADLAAFMGTDVVTAAQAFGRAFAGGAGAADVLRERGVLQLIKDFKGIDDLTKLTLPQFRKALEESISDPAAGVAGSTTALAATFDGAVSNMGDAIEQFAAEAGGNFIPILTKGAKTVASFFSAFTTDPLEDEQAELNATIKTIEKYELGTEKRIQKIKQLQGVYPNLLKNLDAETVSNQQLATALSGANKEFAKRAKLAALEAELADSQSTLVDAYRAEFAAVKQIQKALADYGLTQAAANLSIEDQVKLLQDMAVGEANTGNAVLDTTNALLRLTGVVPNATSALVAYREASKELKAAEIEQSALLSSGIREEIDLQKEQVGVLTQKADIEKKIDEQRAAAPPPRPPTPEIGADEGIDILDDEALTEKVEVAKSFGQEIGDAAVEGIEAANLISAFSPLTQGLSAEASTMERIFAGLIDKMLQKLATLALAQFFGNLASGGIGGLLSGLFSQHGGVKQFQHGGLLAPGMGKVKKAQTGGSFEVPPGYANDSFPLMVETGERVDVTSRGETTAANFKLDAINDSVQALNGNLTDSLSRRNGNGPPGGEVQVTGSIDGSTIYLSNERGGKTYNRSRKSG